MLKAPGSKGTTRRADDLTLLGLVVCGVLSAWLLLGWNWDLFLGNFDLIQGHYPLTQLLIANGFRPVNVSNTIHGGAFISPVAGWSLFSSFLYHVGAGAGTIVNLSAIGAQVCCGFFGAQILKNLSFHRNTKSDLFLFALWSTILISFNPAMIWRVEHGHLPFLWGAAAFLAALSLLIPSILKKPIGWFHGLTAWGVFVNTVPQQAFQILIYSLVILSPWVVRALRSSWTRLLFLAGLAISALICVLPEIRMLLRFMSSDYASRNIGVSAIYSYLIASFDDWDTLVSFGKSGLSPRNPFLNHEMHYPFLIPAALSPVFWPHASSLLRKSMVFFVFAGIFFFIASTQPPILAEILTRVPVVSSFRIIGRANLLVTLACFSILGAMMMEWSIKNHARKWLFFGLALVPLTSFFPEFLPEKLRWTLIGISVLSHFGLKKTSGKKLGAILLSVLLPVFCFLGVQEITRPATSISATENGLEKIKVSLQEANVPRESAVFVDSPLKETIGPNFNMMIGYRGVEGYWVPTPLFNSLWSKAAQAPMDPSRLYFSAIPQTAESNLPHRLRVQFLAKDTAAGLQITRIAPDSPSAMTQGIPDFTPTATESIFFRIIGILILMLVLFSGSFRTDSLLKSIDPFFWPIARVFGALLRHLPRRNRHKILLVRPGGLGDLICLHLALLRVGIDPSKCQWLIEKRSEPWAKLHGLPYECYDSGLIKTLLKWAGRFEQVVDTEQRFGLSSVMALACAAPGAPTFGFRTNRASRLLSVSCDYDPYREHEIDSFERLMKMFLERLTPETRALIDTHLTHTPNMESKVGAKPVIGIAGLQVPSREFSLSQWAAWTRGWVRDRDFSIVAAPLDLEFAKSLAEAFPGQATVQCGTFEENCQTIASASEVFTVDGGMVHIASFYGIPTTAVFTSGRVEKWAPWAPNSQVIKRNDLSCQPCAIFGQVPKCPHGFACKDTSKMNR